MYEIYFNNIPELASFPPQRRAETENLFYSIRVGHQARKAVRHNPHRQHHPERSARNSRKHAHIPPLRLYGPKDSGISAHPVFHL